MGHWDCRQGRGQHGHPPPDPEHREPGRYKPSTRSCVPMATGPSMYPGHRKDSITERATRAMPTSWGGRQPGQLEEGGRAVPCHAWVLDQWQAEL